MRVRECVCVRVHVQLLYKCKFKYVYKLLTSTWMGICAVACTSPCVIMGTCRLQVLLLVRIHVYKHMSEYVLSTRTITCMSTFTSLNEYENLEMYECMYNSVYNYVQDNLLEHVYK